MYVCMCTHVCAGAGGGEVAGQVPSGRILPDNPKTAFGSTCAKLAVQGAL